ncbi:DUF4238 domain-containing protein [Telmatospirillum sp. J64-1]|uniref:DUF4238 domain-containing protein n=1 Tax=Telmatospirillum sp. J64-1 TaxID=2502183 RepID=UPI00115E854C|nr:DUF4238 domain-containing protein [Telmatospirillum sp. J64-1]
MAGKRQHYVPRLLQRGFLHDPAEKAERTWLHRPHTPPKLVGIRDVGVGDWFYSEKSLDGLPTLDDEITALEGDLSAVVNDMRARQPGEVVSPGVAARCVVHLAMRTDHIRRVMLEALTELTDEIQTLFSDTSRLANAFGLHNAELSQTVAEVIREAALEFAPTGAPPPFTERVLSVLTRENRDELIRNAVTTLSPLFPMLLEGLAKTVRNAHNRILATSPEANGWIATLSGFSWAIESGCDLILPDAVVLATEESERLVPLLFTNGESVRAVAMPISSNLVLVGTRDGCEAINVKLFNEHAAAACRVFFISSRPLEDDTLTRLIGTGPAATIQAAVEDAVKSAELGGSSRTPSVSQSATCALDWKNFSYSLHLADYGDDEHVKEVSSVVQSVVGELARHLPLHDLDGLTIAADYKKALMELDRGDANLPSATTDALGYGIGVAKPVNVVREGVQKTHIVISASLAHSWFADDAETRAGALNVLVKMLATVAYWTLLSRNAIATFRPDPLTAQLHPLVATAPCGWFSARESAFVAPHLGGFYADLVIEALEFAELEVSKELESSRRTGDITNVTRRASECVSTILTHAADWLGHRTGLPDGEAFNGKDLPARLQSRGLDKWIELFGSDLAAIHENEADGLNMAFLVRLSQHVERLLWVLGVYAWVDEEESIHCLVSEQRLAMPLQLSAAHEAFN